jgi:hypothetical protein
MQSDILVWQTASFPTWGPDNGWRAHEDLYLLSRSCL